MKRSVLALLATLSIFALACGFFDSEIATVTYEGDFPLEFSIDASDLCPSGSDCEDNQQPANEDVELALIEFAIPLDLAEHATIREGGVEVNARDVLSRMRTLEITSIDYVVSDNDLTFDLPPMELYVAPLSVDDPEHSQSIHLTTMPSVPADTDASENAPTRSEAVDPASDLFKTLEFNAIPSAQPVVKEGQPFPPSGSADTEITVNFRITANPLD